MKTPTPNILRTSPPFEGLRYRNVTCSNGDVIERNSRAGITIASLTVQVSADCTIQIFDGGTAVSVAYVLKANTIWSLPSRYLANNSTLILSISAGTGSFDIWYSSGFNPQHLINFENRFYIFNPTTASVTPINLVQENGATLTAPTADSPLGTEVALIARTISSKRQYTETVAPLGANAVYTGPWRDSELTGDCFVEVTGRADQAGNLQIQETNDTTNSNLFFDCIFNLSTGQYTNKAFLANTTYRTLVNIRSRYWRVVYTNGGVAQGSFSLISMASNQPINAWVQEASGPSSATTNAATNQTPIHLSQSVGATDGVTVDCTIPIYQQGQLLSRPLNGSIWKYCGAAAGTVVTGRGWQKGRTPNVIKTGSFNAVGPTALWTPSTGNFYRLLKFFVSVSGNASLAVAGILTITFNETTTGNLPIVFDVFLPAAAGTGPTLFVSGWIDLGEYGILAAAVNRALNIGLSAALVTGSVRVMVAGCEE